VGRRLASVLQVAQENAATAGIKDRFHALPGSAFDVEYGSGYDLVLMPNFLSHFDPPTCETLLRKVCTPRSSRMAAL